MRSSRASPARGRSLTMEERILERSPSEHSGNFFTSMSVMHRVRTASPRNSRRSLSFIMRSGFSLAKDRCVRAQSRNEGSLNLYPRDASRPASCSMRSLFMAYPAGCGAGVIQFDNDIDKTIHHAPAPALQVHRDVIAGESLQAACFPVTALLDEDDLLRARKT